MAEYIDRKALGIGKRNPEIFDDKGYANGWNAAIDIIQSAPSADVRPVVLCRDCMMRQYCKVAQYLGADGFCSIGEKKRCKLYNDCEYREIWKCCCDDCQFMEES